MWYEDVLEEEIEVLEWEEGSKGNEDWRRKIISDEDDEKAIHC